MQALRVDVPLELIQEFCRHYHIRKLAFFGSVLHDNFGVDSDLDVLVEFEEGHIPGFSFFQIQEELSELFGRGVDLNTPGFLSPYFREDVIQNALVIYEQSRSHPSKTHA
jgi:predicted nucleotidyltransferase